MFWEDTPFEARAQFMRDNVMELSPELDDAFPPAAHPGFAHFRQLLLEIYGTPEAFPGDDPLERFHLLTYATQLFFSAVAAAGSLEADGEALYVAKAAFKKAYKKPGETPFGILPRFGVQFDYEKKGKAAASYGICDAFHVRFPGKSGVARVLKQMAEAIAEVDHKREYAEGLVVLGKADYDRLVLGRSALREEIDPLRPDILRSTGEAAPLYRALIEKSLAMGFSTLAYLQRYANPSWNVNVYQGRKLRLKTIWGETRNFVYLPVPFEQTEAVIQNRAQYQPRVRAAIERFGCVSCGRCAAGKPVQFKRADGITVCNGHNESSTIILEAETAEEVGTLFAIMGSWTT